MFDVNKARLGKRHDFSNVTATCAAAKTMSGANRAGSDMEALADR